MRSKPGLAEEPSYIHTGNSAYGALGLAYHLRGAQVAFLGLDGTQAPYRVAPGAPRTSMAHLPALFASALPQLRGRGTSVVNGSPNSRVTCFPVMRPQEVLKWMNPKS